MIKEGLPSELFLLAFHRPGTGYDLTKRRQNSRTSRSQTYKILDKLVSKGILIKHENKYRHEPSVLLQNMKEYLDKNYPDFGHAEMKYVEMFLSLGSVLSIFALLDMELLLAMEEKADAMESLCQSIGILVASYQYAKKYYISKFVTNNSSDVSRISTSRKSFEGEMQDIEHLKNQFNEKMRKKLKGSKNAQEKKMVTIKTYGDMLGSFLLYSYICEKIPDDMLNKFCKLWDQYMGMECAMEISAQFASVK